MTKQPINPYFVQIFGRIYLFGWLTLNNGTMLSARGLIPAHWNAGEMTYLIAGATVIALWFFVKWLGQSSAKNSQSKSCACSKSMNNPTDNCE